MLLKFWLWVSENEPKKETAKLLWYMGEVDGAGEVVGLIFTCNFFKSGMEWSRKLVMFKLIS